MAKFKYLKDKYNEITYYFELIGSIPEYLRLLDSLRDRQFSALLRSISEQIESKITDPEYFSEEIRQYFIDKQTDGQPYVEYEREPRQVSQLKKILNGLYHGEVALLRVEDYHIYKPKHWLAIWGKLYDTVVHGYEAMDLGTHLDVDIAQILQEQLAAVKPIFDEIKTFLPDEPFYKQFAIKDLPDLETLQDKDYQASLAFSGGVITGKIVEQLRPVKQYDYTFLTQFTSQLPVLFDEAKKWISKIGTKAREVEPDLDEKDIEQLQAEARALLDSIQKIQQNSLLNFNNIMHLIDIVRRLVRISNSIYYQFTVLNTTSHGIIKDWLYQLKTVYLPQLLNCADVLEETLALQPGILSGLILRYFNEYYQMIVDKLTFVSFEDELGSKVFELVDDPFTEARLKAQQARMDKLYIEKVTVGEAQQACEAFYALFAKYRHIHLAEMPVSVKAKLANYYKSMQFYMTEIEPDLDVSIVHFLNKTRVTDGEGVWNGVKWAGVVVKNKLTGLTGWYDVNSDIEKFHDAIVDRIFKDEQTADFKLALNQGIAVNAKLQQSKIENSYERKHYHRYVLSHYQLDSSFLEIAPLAEDSDDKAYLLKSREIEHKKQHLADAWQKYKTFIKILAEKPEVDIAKFSAADKEVLRQLYKSFQPYFVNLFGQYGKRFDSQLVVALNPEFQKMDEYGVPVPNLQLDKRLFQQKTFTPFHQKMKLKIGEYVSQSQRATDKGIQKYIHSLKLKTLEVGTEEERRNFLLKTKAGSETLATIRSSLVSHLEILNDYVVEEVQPQSSGVPFPEIENDFLFQNVPNQVLAIKRIQNALYYIEEAIKACENLNDKSYRAMYVFYILHASKHVYSIYNLMNDIQEDPYVHQLKNQLAELASNFKKAIPYFSGSEEEQAIDVMLETQQAVTAQKPAYEENLKLLLDQFYTAPIKIHATSKREAVSDADITEHLAIASGMRRRIVDVVEDCNSWTKYLINSIEMVSIASDLRARLSKLTTEGYFAVIDNLEELKVFLFVEILEKGDLFEKNLCLKPGTVTQELQILLDQIYKGFISSLHLTENQRFLLMNDPSFINTRIERIVTQASNTHNMIAFAENVLKVSDELDKHIKAFKDAHGVLKFYNQAAREAARKNLVEYVINHKAQIVLGDPAIATFMLKATTPVDSQLLDSLSASVNRLKNYGLNRKATFELDKKLDKSKYDYLLKLREKLTKEFEEKTTQYIENSYQEKLAKIKAQPSDVILLAVDYQKSFEAFAEKRKPKLIERASLKNNEIDISIENDLMTLKRIFDKEHLRKFKALNGILKLVLDYHIQIRNDLYQIETQDSAAQKLRRLSEMMTIANNTKLDPTQRILLISELVKTPEFKNDLALNMQYKAFTWNWFKNWFNSLLITVGLTKSVETKLCEKIAKVEKKLVSPSRVSATLFSPDIEDQPSNLTDQHQAHPPPILVH